MSLENFLEKYSQSNTARFHMPGHKGNLQKLITPDNDIKKAICSISDYDITEIFGADSLYDAKSLILQLEEKISKLYSSAKSVFTTLGATHLIQTMISLCATKGDSIICNRNIHASAINTMMLLGINPVFLPVKYNQYNLIAQPTPEDVEDTLNKNKDVAALYLTGVDYFGQIADISSIAKVCEKYDKPLIIDNAHGANLLLDSKNQHPIKLGAAMVVDSVHKSLGVLTGGAFLHISKQYNAQEYIDKVKSKMALFGSTSPSYLTMLSIDLLINNYSQLQNATEQFVAKVDAVKQVVKNQGFDLVEGEFVDSWKITLSGKPLGYTAQELASYLRANNCECEYADFDFVVLMSSPYQKQSDFDQLVDALCRIKPKKHTSNYIYSDFLDRHQVIPVSDILAKPSSIIPVKESVGRISKQIVNPCPPGMPIIIPGQKILEQDIEIFKYHDIKFIEVVK